MPCDAVFSGKMGVSHPAPQLHDVMAMFLVKNIQVLTS